MLVYGATGAALLAAAILVTFVAVLQVVAAASVLAKAAEAGHAIAVIVVAARLTGWASLAARDQTAIDTGFVPVALVVSAGGGGGARAAGGSTARVGRWRRRDVVGERTSREPDQAEEHRG